MFRGFNIRHDYSRHSSTQNVWYVFIMIAFLVSELFVLLRHVMPIKRNRSIRDFMRSVFADLCKLCQEIFKSPALNKKTQFRYCFVKAYCRVKT